MKWMRDIISCKQRSYGKVENCLKISLVDIRMALCTFLSKQATNAERDVFSTSQRFWWGKTTRSSEMKRLCSSWLTYIHCITHTICLFHVTEVLMKWNHKQTCKIKKLIKQITILSNSLSRDSKGRGYLRLQQAYRGSLEAAPKKIRFSFPQ